MAPPTASSTSDLVHHFENRAFEAMMITEQLRQNKVPISIQIDGLFSINEPNPEETPIELRESIFSELQLSFPSLESEVLGISRYSVVVSREEQNKIHFEFQSFRGNLRPVDLEDTWQENTLFQRLQGEYVLKGFSSHYRLWFNEEEFEDAVTTLELELPSGHYYLEDSPSQKPGEVRQRLAKEIEQSHWLMSIFQSQLVGLVGMKRSVAAIALLAPLYPTLPVLVTAAINPSPIAITVGAVLGGLSTILIYLGAMFTKQQRELKAFQKRISSAKDHINRSLIQISNLPQGD